MVMDPGANLTSRNRLAQMLMAQEQGAAPITSHGQGLASLLRQGLAGFMQGADTRDRSQAYRTMIEGLQAKPWVDPDTGQVAPNQRQAGGFAGAMSALQGLGGNEYAANMIPQLGMQAYEQEEARRNRQPVSVGAGETLLDPSTLEPIFSAPAKPTTPRTVTTAEGVFVLNPDGTPANRIGSAPSSGSTNNIIMPKGADELSKLDAQFISGLDKGVSTLGELLPDLTAMESALDGFQTGAGGEARLFIGKLAQELGIETSGLADGELIKSIQSRLAPAMRPTGSGSSSDKDVTMFLNSLPNLANTPDGNRLIIQNIRRIYERRAQEAAFARQYYIENGYSLAGMRQAMDSELGPLFSEAERRAFAGSTASNAPAPDGTPNASAAPSGFSIQRID